MQALSIQSMLVDLITKFYYRDEQLHFQIFMVCKDGSKVAYGEYTDYQDYKKAYSDLSARKGSFAVEAASEKNIRK